MARRDRTLLISNFNNNLDPLTSLSFDAHTEDENDFLLSFQSWITQVNVWIFIQQGKHHPRTLTELGPTGIFWVPKDIRLDSGSQLTLKLSDDMKSLFGFIVLGLCRSQANGLAERRVESMNTYMYLP